MKTILIDMDGVSCHFVPAVCREANKRTGGNLKPEDITDWVMGKFGVERTDWQKPGFFANLEPIEGATDTLYRWHKEHRLIIVTDTMGVDFVEADKRIWLAKHLPFIKEVICTTDKSGVPGDLLFDDAPHHLADFPGITVKMLTPYNTDTPADYTVKSWKEFDQLLRLRLFKKEG